MLGTPVAISPPLGDAVVRTRHGPSWLPDVVRRNVPAVALVGLSITFAELLSGSTPVLALVLSPLSGVFLLGLYGSGVLLVREVAVRWRKGWPSVLLLGGAYGVLEEGFTTRTFFDPALVGHLGVYGHWIGVNWVAVGQLIVYHSVISIALPVLVLGLWFPETKGRRLLTRREMGVAAGALVLTSVTMYWLYIPGFHTTLVWNAVFVAVLVALVIAAFLVPGRWPFPRTTTAPRRPRSLAVAGGMFSWLLFGITWTGTLVIPWPALDLGLLAVLCGACASYAADALERPGAEASRVALAGGVLSFLVVFAGIMDLVGDWGSVVVAVAVVYLLWRLWRRSTPGPMFAGPPAVDGPRSGAQTGTS